MHPRPLYHAGVPTKVTGSRHILNQVNHLATYVGP